LPGNPPLAPKPPPNIEASGHRPVCTKQLHLSCRSIGRNRKIQLTTPMSERQFTRSCPLCGAVSPLSTPACLRCNHAFPPATIRPTASFSYKKTFSWIEGCLLTEALLLLPA